MTYTFLSGNGVNKCRPGRDVYFKNFVSKQATTANKNAFVKFYGVRSLLLRLKLFRGRRRRAGEYTAQVFGEAGPTI